jgi:hypothetical protein
VVIYNLTARARKIRILSKYKPTLKRQILKEENKLRMMFFPHYFQSFIVNVGIVFEIKPRDFLLCPSQFIIL